MAEISGYLSSVTFCNIGQFRLSTLISFWLISKSDNAISEICIWILAVDKSEPIGISWVSQWELFDEINSWMYSFIHGTRKKMSQTVSSYQTRKNKLCWTNVRTCISKCSLNLGVLQSRDLPPCSNHSYQQGLQDLPIDKNHENHENSRINRFENVLILEFNKSVLHE